MRVFLLGQGQLDLRYPNDFLQCLWENIFTKPKCKSADTDRRRESEAINQTKIAGVP